MKALIRLRFTRRPISQEVLGYRLQATVPNLAARKMKAIIGQDGTADSFAATKEQVPSFRKPYLIAESSDCSSIGKNEIEKFIKDLMWQGFDEWEFFGNWDAAGV